MQGQNHKYAAWQVQQLKPHVRFAGMQTRVEVFLEYVCSLGQQIYQRV